MTKNNSENSNIKKVSCCENCKKYHYPRYPYTLTEQACDYCCIGCDKPGLGSNAHDPYNNSCSDCALLCVPCTIVIDIICCCPRIFGFCEVTKP